MGFLSSILDRASRAARVVVYGAEAAGGAALHVAHDAVAIPGAFIGRRTLKAPRPAVAPSPAPNVRSIGDRSEPMTARASSLQAIPTSTQEAAAAQARSTAELGSFVQTAALVPGVGAVLAPVVSIGNAIAGVFGYSATFAWPDNFNPYTGDGTPFHSSISLWDNEAPQGKPIGASGIIPHVGETIRHAAIRNQLTYWRQQAHPLTTLQEQWLALDGGTPAPVPPPPSLVSDAGTNTAGLTQKQLAAATSYGITPAQAAIYIAQGGNPLVGGIVRSKFPALFA